MALVASLCRRWLLRGVPGVVAGPVGFAGRVGFIKSYSAMRASDGRLPLVRYVAALWRVMSLARNPAQQGQGWCPVVVAGWPHGTDGRSVGRLVGSPPCSVGLGLGVACVVDGKDSCDGCLHYLHVRGWGWSRWPFPLTGGW